MSAFGFSLEDVITTNSSRRNDHVHRAKIDSWAAAFRASDFVLLSIAWRTATAFTAGCETAPARSRCWLKARPIGSSVSADALVAEAPPLAQPKLLVGTDRSRLSLSPDFQIHDSETARSDHIHLPPDHFACDDCLDRNERSATTGASAIPSSIAPNAARATPLIERLPYDRANTSMARFPLCHALRG